MSARLIAASGTPEKVEGDVVADVAEEAEMTMMMTTTMMTMTTMMMTAACADSSKERYLMSIR